jgi:hypothetical protein
VEDCASAVWAVAVIAMTAAARIIEIRFIILPHRSRHLP